MENWKKCCQREYLWMIGTYATVAPTVYYYMYTHIAYSSQ